MKLTLAQKLVARAAGRSSVTPGEIVTCTFTNTRNTGSLKIIKSVTGYTGYEGSFPVNVACTGDGGS